MILVRLIGGLGNQMFQYAFAYSLAKKNNTVLKVDTSLLKDKSKPHEIVTHRDFVLEDVFDLSIEIASNKEIEYFNGKVYKSLIGKIINKILWQFKKHRLIVEQDRGFNSDLLQLSDNVCIVGSFQSEKYFIDHDTIKSLYKFKYPILPISTELSSELKTKNSVAVHIRRGDYVTSPLYSKTIGVLPISYYINAIALIKEKTDSPVFYVFSDDINWCKNELKIPNTIFNYVGDEHAGINAANYMQLLSLCKHFIISNSTFAWWAAWLGEHRDSLIIGPNNWFIDKSNDVKDILPERWAKI